MEEKIIKLNPRELESGEFGDTKTTRIIIPKPVEPKPKEKNQSKEKQIQD